MRSDTPSEARDRAHELVQALGQARPELVEVGGVPIGPALEQQLFFAFRDGAFPPAALATVARELAAIGRLVGASAASLLGRLAPRPDDRPIVVLVREPTHYAVLALLEAEMQRIGQEALTMLRVGRAAAVVPPHARAPGLASQLDPLQVPVLARFQAHVAARLPAATRTWPAAASAVAARELPRIAGAALALSSVARRWQPALLLALDEVGTWARLLPAVARRYAIPSLDLPHAEAADADAIRGAGYDRMAVYGERAAAVLAQAGIGAERIVQIGAPRFDGLIAGSVAPVGQRNGAVRRVVYAAQYVSGAMTEAALDECLRAAMSVAEAVAPAELVVVPHPADAAGAGTAAADRPPMTGVGVRVAHGEDLQDLLPGAWAMVTGWSNSVFEAAIAGVPSIALDPGGVAPVDFAHEGLAIGAVDATTAAQAARSLLDDGVRAEAVDRARAVLPARLGVLDGRATERAARLVLEMAASAPGPKA